MTRSPRARLVRPVLLAVLLAGAARPAAAQEVELTTGVTPAEVTVGDPFRSVLRVAVPAGVRVEFDAEPLLGSALQAVAPLQRLDDGGGAQVTAVYTLVAWETGALGAPAVDVRLLLPDGTERAVRAALAVPDVRSVLPAEGEVEPRPSRSIIPAAPGFPWLWLLVGLVLLLIGLGLLLWTRRRRALPPLPGPDASPRERALAELERARAMRRGGAGEAKPFFSAVSGAVRGYLDGVSERWSADLSTPELLRAVERDGVEEARRERLERVLDLADRVKFARYRPDAGEADRAWDDARRVVLDWEDAGDTRPARAPAEVGR